MKVNKLSIAIASLFTTAALLSGCGTDGKDGASGTAGKDGAGQVIALEQNGRTLSRGFDVSASEIVAYDKKNNRIFSVNGKSGQVDVFANLAAATPTLSSSIDLGQLLLANGVVTNVTLVGGANSVAVSDKYAAVAVAANPKTDKGWVVFLNLADLTFARAVSVGHLPDMVTFTPDGTKAIVANEGEPSDNYSVDPEGSISVINTADFTKVDIGFTDFNVGGTRHSQLDLTKMIIDGYSATNAGNKATVAQSLEPEYITVSDDGTKAFVSLQENNAIAVVNLTNNSIDKIFGLGFKDHSIPGNEMDASQKDGVNIKNWPVMGMYMPDSMASMTYNGKAYILTANEGDAREDWLNGVTDSASCTAAGYYFKSKCRDELALRDIGDSDMTIGTGLTGLNTDNTLGRLKFSYFTTKVMNGGTAINKLYAYGGRSFSIWDAETGAQVFDSGSFFETKTAQLYGANFNNDNAANIGDDRSDNKGPEPEAITVGKINGHTYAFIGLERMGGIMVYDISNPFSPEYVQYVNPRDFTQQPAGTDTTYSPDVGDLGPEGFKFVSAAESPTGKDYLIVGNEVSGTTTVYQINVTALQK
ncbi:MAG: hypothetical protein B7X52_04775 [Thiotrichales bacterium 34-46-19]|nr:MAG: hypothetical protein B7X52_04775 [Thiotrichales bacterium 34-46-19]HQT05286.1 choice-of-anchor I family protein [Thiotrichales bacterium]